MNKFVELTSVSEDKSQKYILVNVDYVGMIVPEENLFLYSHGMPGDDAVMVEITEESMEKLLGVVETVGDNWCGKCGKCHE